MPDEQSAEPIRAQILVALPGRRRCRLNIHFEPLSSIKPVRSGFHV
jgi:hypothetical protein